jgi:hypothetical protein
LIADHDPGGDANVPYLRGVIAAYDQVGAERRRLPVEDLRVGETHVIVGTFCSEDVLERLSVHCGRDSDEYAHGVVYEGLLLHEGSLPIPRGAQK